MGQRLFCMIGSDGFLTLLGLALLVSLLGCGPKGGSGAQSPIVTQPPPMPALTPIPDSAEFQAQYGLEMVAAGAAFEAALTGAGTRTGIVDSGVDADHREFSASLYEGGNYQFDAPGALVDPYGHGTHVASITAANQDAIGMQGVAPATQVYSYRILNNQGYFGGQSGNHMVPALVSDALADSVQILNNSWASNLEIDDLSKSQIKSLMTPEIQAWSKAVNAGMVMVWAAGNDGEHHVSKRAGLPHHFSALQSGWLAVVAVGPDGRETAYTNRCGLAADWCLTAPGGGDRWFEEGIYGAEAGGDYILKSGTSMAAPHVSGMVAVVLEAFPEMTPQMAATRLLATANYDGLTTISGCTEQSCGTEAMAAVFGQGMADLEQALLPVGSLMVAGAEGAVSLTGSQLEGPESLLLAQIRAGLADQYFAATDSFDGAAFMVAAEPLLLTKSAPTEQPAHLVYATPTETGESRFFVHGHQPDTNPLSGQHHLFTDSSAQPYQFLWQIETAPQSQITRQMQLAYRTDRQALRWQIDLHSRQAETDQILSFSHGFARSEAEWMDMKGTEALAIGGSEDMWFGLHYQLQTGPVTWQPEFLFGQSRLLPASGSVLRAAEHQFLRWQMAMRLALSSHNHLSLGIVQPAQISKAEMSVVGLAGHDGDMPLAFSAPAKSERLVWAFEQAADHQNKRQRQLRLHGDVDRQGTWQIATTLSLPF